MGSFALHQWADIRYVRNEGSDQPTSQDPQPICPPPPAGRQSPVAMGSERGYSTHAQTSSHRNLGHIGSHHTVTSCNGICAWVQYPRLDPIASQPRTFTFSSSSLFHRQRSISNMTVEVLSRLESELRRIVEVFSPDDWKTNVSCPVVISLAIYLSRAGRYFKEYT
jgi:hypothetical protein